MNQTQHTIQVALPSPFRRLFDYKVPSTYPEPIVGARVSVPFGHQQSLVGLVISHNPSSTPSNKLRDILQILDDQPVLDRELLTLCQWCAEYYHYPLGDVCQLALPANLRKPKAINVAPQYFWRLTHIGKSTNIESLKRAPKQLAAVDFFQSGEVFTPEILKQHNISSSTLKALTEKKIIEKIEGEVQPLSAQKTITQDLLKEPPLTLNSEQQQALDSIQYKLFNTTLLDGITGSGKTEVYLQAIEKVLKDKRQVLVLVPEIGLTPQTLARFEQRFHQPITTLHSGLTDKQRFTIWQHSRQGQINILIGTRSSIFTPLPNLGLIVIDEEHDLSYKQQEGVRYSARDIAIVRAQKLNIPLILGSATPSLESLQNALSGRYQHRLLRQRTKNQALPTFECIDTSNSDITEASLNAIQHTLDDKQQALVFINRRGYAPTLICKDCGWMSLCQNCDCRMTVHRKRNGQLLHCHYCDRRHAAPTSCPNCHSQRLIALGSGTQRTEETLENRFPQTPILRIDRDSVSRKGQLEAILEKVNSGQPCILVGTQMLAKGHHFPNLGLGVILGMDQAFFSSDFRGAERMGQLLTQVAGRIGRDRYQGKVFIQTQFSDHPLLQLLLNEGYEPFAKHLLEERKLTGMPPFEHLALLRCHAQQPQLAEQFLQQARRIAEQISPPHRGLQYLGPFPATIEKRNNRYHFLLQIKSADRRERQQLLKQLCEKLETTKQPRGLHWLVDVDAQEF